MIARVQPGVFFDPPESLPRGRHSVPREQIVAAQRERLMVAATELLADGGYGAVRTAAIAKRAGVSLESFYAIFADKETCLHAGYDRFIEVLLQRQTAGLGDATTWRDFIETAIPGYLQTLQADLVVARAFQLEMDALGATARARRRESLELFARASAAALEHLRALDPLLDPPEFEDAMEIHLAGTYAVRQLACDALDTSQEPDLLAMAPDIVAWLVSSMYGGASWRQTRPPRTTVGSARLPQTSPRSSAG